MANEFSASVPASATAAASARHYTLKAIFWGGLFAGTSDLVFAFIYYGARGATKLGVMQSVAGGLIGKTAAHEGGAATAALGVACHYVVALSAAATYFFASRRLPVLVKHAVPCGLLFGAAVYFFMNMVVLPLSAYHSHAWPPPLAFYPILVHIVGVGLPIALVARHYSRR